MIDVRQSLNNCLDGQNDTSTGGGNKGGNFGGGLVGPPTGTKAGREIRGNALADGGTAMLGGLAYKAWGYWQSGKPALTPQTPAAAGATPPPPSGSAFVPQPGQETGLKRALIRATIGAAKADGQIDPRERQRMHA